MGGFGISFIDLVPARFVGNVLDVAVDLVHGLGHGGDVVFGRAGDGVVVDLVCHFSILDKFLIFFGFWWVNSGFYWLSMCFLVGGVVLLVIGYGENIRHDQIDDLDRGNM